MKDRPEDALGHSGLNCPSCGQERPLRIAYGYPTSEMFKASERGELALGGCVIEEDSPTWRCPVCRHEWGGSPPTLDGLAAVTFGGRDTRPEAAS